MSDGLKLVRSILDQEATTQLRILTDDFFVGEDELKVFKYVTRHFRLYSEMLTHETVGADTGVSLPRATETSNYYFDRCYDRRMFNAVRNPFNDLRTALMENNAAAARTLIQSMSTSVRRFDAEQDLLTMDELSDAVMRLYNENLMSVGLSGITTGWPTLDNVTGGYQDGDFIVWVSRMGIGKTHLLIHAARRAWMSGKKILFVSMEMTLRQIATRFYAHHAGVDPDLFRKGRLSSVVLHRVEEAMRELEDDVRFNLFAGNFKGKRTNEIDILCQELSPDIVFIDGLYIMQPSSAPSRIDRVSKVGYIADEIKQIALQRERPIVATTQFNRDAGKGGKGGTMENIGFSDALGQHASLVMGIKMPHNNKERQPKQRVVELMKGREGEDAQIAINFKFKPVDFSECDDATSRRILGITENNDPHQTDSASVTEFMYDRG